MPGLKLPSLGQLNYPGECPPPLKGLFDGLEPSLNDSLYDPRAAPVLENIRTGGGQWETRFGISLWRNIGGSGNTHFLGRVVGSNGNRYSLAARGGVLYDWEEDGADVAYQAVSGGTGLSTARPLQGVQLDGYFYFTDRSGALRSYKIDPSSVVATVALPAAPAEPVAKGRHWGYLERWEGTDPFGWTLSDTAKFDIEDATADGPWPGDGNTARLNIKTTASIDATATDNVTGEELNSATVAFWVKGSKKESFVVNLGENTTAEMKKEIEVPRARKWYPYFFSVGTHTKLNYKRLRVNTDDDAPFTFAVGPWVLPGRLQGTYRWRVTHYNSTANIESPLSDASNGNVPLDLSAIGYDKRPETEPAFYKCAAITVASDSGSDATTDKIRLYRSGGVPSLTVNSSGREIWIKVGEILDFSTQIDDATGVSTSDNTVVLDSVTGLAVGDWLVFQRGTTSEDVRRITAINAGTRTVTLDEVFGNAHADNSAVQVCFVDNVANESVDPTQALDVERDNPPDGAYWLDRAPDNRIWIFGWTGNADQVAVSSRATPERPYEYRVFPDGVDPLTRQSLLQGWRFRIAGAAAGEKIMWGGFFGGVPTILTRTGVYQVNAQSQVHWGPHAVVKVLDGTGCISGDTVAQAGGRLYWVSDGPKVVAWDGQSAPEVISTQRVTTALKAAPTAYWDNWFSLVTSLRDGQYYCLFMTPSGQTTNTKVLEFNTSTGVWETCIYETSGSALRPWAVGHVNRAPGDVFAMYVAHPTSGDLFRLDDPATTTDNSTPIRIRFETKKFPLGGATSKLERFWLQMPQRVTDTISVTPTTGGAQYGEVSHTYSLVLNGTGDKELHQRTHFDFKGKWVKFAVTGTVSNRPIFRALRWEFQPVRSFPLV